MNAIVKVARIAAVMLIITLLPACKNKSAYLHFETLPTEGWHQDSVLRYVLTTEDSQGVYDLMFHIRHTPAYPYQNMWLFVTRTSGEVRQTDTLELYLADGRGAWLGNGRNGLITMPVIYDEQVRLGGDTMTITIQHGMRDSMLRGVQDVGVELIVDN